MAAQARMHGQTVEREVAVSEELAKQGKGGQETFYTANKETRRLEDPACGCHLDPGGL